MRIRLNLLIIASIIISTHASEPDRLMSLEELINVRVQSASHYLEDQNYAPGVITVVTAEDIQSFGARDLRDVLNRLVGMQIIGSHQYAHNVASIRAVNTALIEDNVLLLLNGRPLRQTSAGVHNGDIYMGFPLAMIERIEVIRGPGSVIYGSNAMAGLINIITKAPSQEGVSSMAKVTLGSFGRRQIEATTGLWDDDYNFEAAVNSIRSKGDDVYDVKDESGNPGTYKSGAKSDNLLLNAQYKDLTINAMIMQESEDAHSSTFQFPAQTVDYKRYFLDLGYHYDINPAWNLSLNYTLNKNSVDFVISDPIVNDARAQSHLFETIIHGNISQDMNLIVGASYANDSAQLGSGLDYRDIWRKTLYSQIDYSMWEDQKWILGGQLNLSQGGQTHLSPRYGFVQGFQNNWWFKALYSEAFRAPNLVELYSTASFAVGNPSLQPVTIKTQDLQLIYQDAHTYAALALYNSVMNDLISRDNSVTPPQHINQGSIHFQGIEFEGKQRITTELKLSGNANYQVNKTNTGVKDSTYAPNYMVKIGLEYSGPKGTNISVFNSYIGSSTDLNATGDTPLNNPKPKAYNLLSANITMDTAKLWDMGKEGNSIIGIYLDNLFNEDVYAPDLLHRNKNNSIPDHWGRSINISYTYRF